MLKSGGTIVEPTSGNMGVALAIVAAVKGYKCIFTIPDKMSIEKIRRLRAFGAEVVVTPTAVRPESSQSYYSVARRLAEEIPGAYMPMQYDNLANREAHYASTGPEIWEQTDGQITHFVSGIGTAGTISGTAKYLKEKNPQCTVVGVDPEGSILAKAFKREKWSWSDSHPYKVEGIGEDFVPKNLLIQYIDDVVTISDRDSFLMGRRLPGRRAFSVEDLPVQPLRARLNTLASGSSARIILSSFYFPTQEKFIFRRCTPMNGCGKTSSSAKAPGWATFSNRNGESSPSFCRSRRRPPCAMRSPP